MHRFYLRSTKSPVQFQVGQKQKMFTKKWLKYLSVIISLSLVSLVTLVVMQHRMQSHHQETRVRMSAESEFFDGCRGSHMFLDYLYCQVGNIITEKMICNERQVNKMKYYKFITETHHLLSWTHLCSHLLRVPSTALGIKYSTCYNIHTEEQNLNPRITSPLLYHMMMRFKL